MEGRIEEHHRFLLKLQLDRLDSVEKDLEALEQRIQEKLQPYAAQLALLKETPGVDWTLAAVIIAELGVDMGVFQSVSQLASWAGVCPGNNESAGKRKSSRIPKGNVYLKKALVEAANSAAKAKGTYLRDKFYRLKARRGYKRAAVAIAHKILVALYHMFSQQVSYNDPGRSLPRQAQQEPSHAQSGPSSGTFGLRRDTDTATTSCIGKANFHDSPNVNRPAVRTGDPPRFIPPNQLVGLVAKKKNAALETLDHFNQQW